MNMNLCFFCTILIPLILLVIAAYVRSSISCNFYYIGSTNCTGGENRTEVPVAGRFAGKTDSQTGLCPILLSKHPLNRPGQFARRPDRRFGRQPKPFGTHTHYQKCSNPEEEKAYILNGDLVFPIPGNYTSTSIYSDEFIFYVLYNSPHFSR